MRLSTRAALVTVICLAAAPAVRAEEAALKYVAHACFQLVSPQGVRVVIDPYNSNRWLGYHFPEGVAADVVLTTHPHYDHDAAYYWGADTPVLRAPGSYVFGDVKIEGVRGVHAGPYGKEFEQRNTIWAIETAGVRIVHVGDNGPLNPDMRNALGRADVLLAPVDDLDHILTRSEVREMQQQLRASVLIPMHYRLEALSPLPKSVGPIDEWLTQSSGVKRFETNQITLADGTLPAESAIWVVPPSPDVRPWSESLQRAWDLRNEARAIAKKDPEAAIRLRRRARAEAPQVIEFAVELADALIDAGRRPEAQQTLEQALAGIPRADREYHFLGRVLLARLYRRQGREDDAAAQYRFVAGQTYRTAWNDEATEFLADR